MAGHLSKHRAQHIAYTMDNFKLGDLRERIRLFGECVSTENMGRLQKLCMDDVIAIAPGATAQGSKELVRLIQENTARFSSRHLSVRHTVDSVVIHTPDMAVSTQQTELRDTTDMPVVVFKGVDVWQLIDSQWYLRLNIFNSAPSPTIRWRHVKDDTS